jgi:hypothetical protein
MGERTETRTAPAWGEGPGAVALAGLVGLALGAFWLAGVPRLAPWPTGEAPPPAIEAVHLGGEAWVPLGGPVAVRGRGMRPVGRSNEGYLVFVPDAPTELGEAHRPLLAGGGGGGWVPPNGVDPPRDRLFLAVPNGRWLPLARR